MPGSSLVMRTGLQQKKPIGFITDGLLFEAYLTLITDRPRHYRTRRHRLRQFPPSRLLPQRECCWTRLLGQTALRGPQVPRERPAQPDPQARQDQEHPVRRLLRGRPAPLATPARRSGRMGQTNLE